MNINYPNNINFTAKYKDYSPNIKRLQYKDKYTYQDEPTSFAEIDCYNERDMEALKNLSEAWDGALFIQNIYLDAQRASDENYTGKNKFYIITEQKDYFDYLDYKKILAICEINEYKDKEVYLDYIEADPKAVCNPFSKYKKIGTALLTCLKHYYNKIRLMSLPYESVLSFYKRNSFSGINNVCKYHLFWEKKNDNK